MHECYAFVANNKATTICAFVAKNLAAKTIAPPIPASVAIATATTIRAFVAKNLASDSYSLLRFFINPSATHDFTKNKFGLGY